jgi:hypothetical protein
VLSATCPAGLVMRVMTYQTAWVWPNISPATTPVPVIPRPAVMTGAKLAATGVLTYLFGKVTN